MMEPLVFRSENGLQLSYDVPHRIYCASVHPLRSPNGSSIVIYGHERGLRIVWRGGKPFKPHNVRTDGDRINGNGIRPADSEPINLDDDDEPEVATGPTEAQFDDEEDEIDPSQPYQKILRFIDIDLETGVLHLSLPSIPYGRSQARLGAYPEILSTHIIVAVACSDASLRVVSLPLQPPAPKDKDPSHWGLDVIKLEAPIPPSVPPSGISITHCREDIETRSSSRSRSQGRSNSASARRTWHFLVAATSSWVSGVLLIYKIPIGVSSSKMRPESLLPIQRQLLDSAVGCKIGFNPSFYPAARYSDLFVAYPTGTVKLYRCFPNQSDRSPDSRRGSNITTDSSKPIGWNAHSGKFIFSLSCDFVKTPKNTAKRDGVLDAAWVLGGRGLLVLLESGCWGVWDLEGAGPVPESRPPGLWQRPANIARSGVNGGAITKFSLSGHVMPISKPQGARNTDSHAGKIGTHNSTLPNSTKSESRSLFHGHPVQPTRNASQWNYGQVSVLEHVSDYSTSSVPDESILLTYGSHNISISSLLALWRAQLSDKGTLEPSLFVRPNILPEVLIPSGRQVDVAHLFLKTEEQSGADRAANSSNLASNTGALLAFERRLVFLVQPVEDTPIDDTANDPVLLEDNYQQDEDRMLLDRGELDVDGMDRILDDMSNNITHKAGALRQSGRAGR
ncbi:MAG: hypothetical protein Q9227_008889 [Pyrenula ochraceoflavens]